MKTEFTKEEGKQEFWFSRTFDAPRDLVFRLYNDPGLFPQWWGPAKYNFDKIDINVKPGGTWQVLQSDAEGRHFGFHGVYHEVKPPEKVIWTFEFDDVPGHVSLETVIFEEIDGKAKVTGQSVYQSVADRDAMVSSGMESGLNEGLDRFEELLKEKVNS